MSFGVGIGDIVLVSRFAWKVYKGCKSAPDSFGNIAHDVKSLKTVLDETEEIVAQEPPTAARAERLQEILGGCRAVLNDLNALVEKYHSLGTQTKRTWDRMKLHAENITEIRSRLTPHITMLNIFLSTSQITVQLRMEQLLKECQRGDRGGSAISMKTIESLTMNEREAWRQIRKELEDVGITIAAFNANKDFILQWFTNARATGAFDEQPEDIDDLEGASPGSYSTSAARWNVQTSSSVMNDQLRQPLFQGEASAGKGDFQCHSAITQDPTKDNQPEMTIDTETDQEHNILQKKPSRNSASRLLVRLYGRPRSAFPPRSIGSPIDAPIHVALREGRSDQVKVLLEGGADSNSEDELGQTPLHVAVTAYSEANNFDLKYVVENLVIRGAELGTRDKGSFTTLDHALWLDCDEAVNIVLDAGANMIDGQNFFSKSSALCTVIARCPWSETKRQAAVKILDRGLDIDEVGVAFVKRKSIFSKAEVSPEWEMQPPIIAATKFGALEAVVFLLEHGADVLQRDKHGKLASDYANGRGKPIRSNKLHWKSKFDLLTEHERTARLTMLQTQ